MEELFGEFLAYVLGGILEWLEGKWFWRILFGVLFLICLGLILYYL